MLTALVIIHVIIALVLTAIVLLQHGRQQGLSGAIAGGAETFFGKNKGRTIDSMLRKFTAVFAILFILSSIVLTYVSIKQANAEEEANAPTDDTSQTMNVTMDENGNLVDESGNIVMSAEDMQAQQDAAASEEGTEAEGAADAAEGTVDEAANAAEGAVDEAADAAEGAVDEAADAAEGAVDEAANAAEGAADAAAGAAEGAAE